LVHLSSRLTGLTAWHAMVELAAVKEGMAVLVHSVSAWGAQDLIAAAGHANLLISLSLL